MAKGQRTLKGNTWAGSDHQWSWKSAGFTLAVACTVCASIFAVFELKKNRKRAITEEESIGPWTLIDHNGKVVSSRNYNGKWQLIYFGFTFCPDICPQELDKQGDVTTMVENEFGECLKPLYITVDPARDTCAQLRTYLEDFHPRTVGLTGTPEMIKLITRKFRVYFNQGIKSGDDDYLVDHSIIHYLVNPAGQFVDFYGKNLTPDEMAKKVKGEIKEYNASKKNRKADSCADVE